MPDFIRFYRTPISSPEPDIPASGVPAAKSFASPLSTESAVATELVAIYGSVSVADIAEQVKAVLAATEEGARVVLGPEDIKIIRNEGQDAQAEADRIKMLGDFRVDIRVKGGDVVRRTVRIIGEEGL